MTPEERSEIEKVQSGEPYALERLLTKKKSLVNLVARSYYFKGGDESDLAEEATIALISAAMSFNIEKNDSFDAYAAILMRRRVINAVKGGNRFKHAPLNNAEPLSIPIGEDGGEITRDAASEDPVDHYLNEEENRRFYDAAKQILTDAEFRVLQLYLDGFSYREIAQHIVSTAKDVDNTLFRIKKKIKREKGLFYDGDSE